MRHLALPLGHHEAVRGRLGLKLGDLTEQTLLLHNEVLGVREVDELAAEALFVLLERGYLRVGSPELQL